MGRTLAKISAKPTVRQTDKCRAAIQASQLIRHLQAIALGKREGTPTQVRAASVLLAKVIPDMQSMAVTREDPPPSLTVEELRERMKHMARAELLSMTPQQRQQLLDDNIELLPLEKSNASG